MQLELNREKKELKSHGSYGFPVLVSYERLSRFETRSFPWHWHPELELTLVLEGDIAYQANDSLYELKEGEGLLCNTNVLHSGRRLTSQDCSYLSITFHPRILYGYSSSLMRQKYVDPVLNNPALSSIRLDPGTDWQKRALEQAERIRRIQEERPLSAELQVQIGLLEIWREIYEHVDAEQGAYAENGRDTERIRQIMEYIQLHYTERITLEDLADQIHLCRSESCRLFKRYMNETMFDYLLGYRIEKSLELLKETGYDVTWIAGQTGFSSPGYYSRIFKRKMGCTPLEYRRNKRG